MEKPKLAFLIYCNSLHKLQGCANTTRWLNLDILESIGPKEWENHIAHSCFKLFVKQCHPNLLYNCLAYYGSRRSSSFRSLTLPVQCTIWLTRVLLKRVDKSLLRFYGVCAKKKNHEKYPPSLCFTVGEQHKLKTFAIL